MDPWLKIKQNCPMCKSSITSTPPSDAPFNRTAVVASSGSPAADEDDLSMINLSHNEEEDGLAEPGVPQGVSQETHDVPLEIADSVSNQTSDAASDLASDSPLLPMTEQPGVEITPYSPQVELNVESLLPSQDEPV